MYMFLLKVFLLFNKLKLSLLNKLKLSVLLILNLSLLNKLKRSLFKQGNATLHLFPHLEPLRSYEGIYFFQFVVKIT